MEEAALYQPLRLIEDGGKPLRVSELGLTEPLCVVGSWDGWTSHTPFSSANPDVSLGRFPVGTVLSYRFCSGGRWFSDPDGCRLTNASDDAAQNNVLVVTGTPRLTVSVSWPSTDSDDDETPPTAAILGSCTGWELVPFPPRARHIDLYLPPGLYEYKLTDGNGKWLVDRRGRVVTDQDGNENNSARVYPFVCGFENPDARCFLNTAVQALYSLSHVRNLTRWIDVSIKSTTPAPPTASAAAAAAVAGAGAGSGGGGGFTASSSSSSSPPSSSPSSSVVDLPIIAALNEAFDALELQVGPSHCHKLHHFAIEGRWFNPCEPDDSANTVSMLLSELSTAAATVSSLSSTLRAGHPPVLTSTIVEERTCMSPTCSYASSWTGGAMPLVCPSLAPSSSPSSSGPTTIAALFQSGWAGPMLDRDCSSCSAPDSVLLTRKFVTGPPPVLVIQLPFRTRDTWPLDEVFESPELPGCQYQLQAVIAKSGGSGEVGHYVTAVRQAVAVVGDKDKDKDKDTSSLWWLVDDERLSLFPPGMPIGDAPVFAKFTPCMLMYHQIYS